MLFFKVSNMIVLTVTFSYVCKCTHMSIHMWKAQGPYTLLCLSSYLIFLWQFISWTWSFPFLTKLDTSPLLASYCFFCQMSNTGSYRHVQPYPTFTYLLVISLHVCLFYSILMSPSRMFCNLQIIGEISVFFPVINFLFSSIVDWEKNFL